MKMVILDGYTINPGDLSWSALEALGEVKICHRTPAEKVAETIGDVSAVFTSKNKITAEIMDACPDLRFIGVLATGFDNIDIEAAKARGIAVCNVPSYSTDTVAQHTFALILEITNHVGLHNAAVQSGEWTASPDFCLIKSPIQQLAGKSLGIVGYGNIGRKVAAIAEAFGMTVNIYSRDREAAMKSDILTLHCPATAENRGFINAEFISGMKDGAILINTARGALINEADLADALSSGKISAAGLDVVNGEPPQMGNPLIGLPNCFITPHVAWASKEARNTICEVSAANLRSWLDDGSLNRIV
jgi:glycerate dehydrogenase